MIFNDTVTLFNRYESRLGDVWYPTVLKNVYVSLDKAAIIEKYGADSQDSAVLHVPYKKDGSNMMIAKKKWLPPIEWDKQTNDQLSKTLTFSSGQAFDFFWIGEWKGEDMISDDSYLSFNGFFSYMNTSYNYTFAISSVSGPFKLMPHFEIFGK